MLVINFYFVNHFPSILMDIIAFIIIGILAKRIYKKHEEKPKIWKMLLILFIGLFAFSFTLPVYDAFVKIPILPLGVWILYFVFRNKVEKWMMYRRFAWLGFLANFIFLAAAFASFPIEKTLYPQDKLSTYIARTDQANIYTLHTSVKETTLKKGVLNKQLSEMQPERIDSQRWYNDIVNIDVPQEERKEKFPFQIMGTEPRWGSGLKTAIFVERDGKGLLITTQKKQYYFRSNESLVKGVE